MLWPAIHGNQHFSTIFGMSMWGFNSTGSPQRPSGSKQVNQTKTLTRRNFSKKALEALLEDLPNPTAAICGQPFMLQQLSRFSPIGPAVCVRFGIALHQLTSGMLVCAALSAFSVVSSRYCVVFRELSKPSGTFQTRDTYFFHLFHSKDMDF